MLINQLLARAAGVFLIAGVVGSGWIYYRHMPALPRAKLEPAAVAMKIQKADAAAKVWDTKAALALLLPLAEAGDAEAQFRVAHLYDVDGALFQIKGKGGQLGSPEADFENAKGWYRKSADQGYVRAEGYLGKLYTWGIANMRGAGTDNAEGMRLLLKAANQGDTDSEAALGFNYLQGVGTEMDTAEAIKWLRKAAEDGEPNAAGQLGSIYMSGEGAPRDIVEAYVWLTLAGEAPGDIAKKLTMEQIEDAGRRIEEIESRRKKR